MASPIKVTFPNGQLSWSSMPGVTRESDAKVDRVKNLTLIFM